MVGFAYLYATQMRDEYYEYGPQEYFFEQDDTESYGHMGEVTDLFRAEGGYEPWRRGYEDELRRREESRQREDRWHDGGWLRQTFTS